MGHDFVGRDEIYIGYAFESDFLYDLDDCYKRNKDRIDEYGDYELKDYMAEELNESWEKFANEKWENYNFPNLQFYFFYSEYIAAYECTPTSKWHAILGYKSKDFKQAKTSDNDKESLSITLDFPTNCLEVLVSFIQKIQTEQRGLALTEKLREKPISKSDDLKKEIHLGIQSSVSNCVIFDFDKLNGYNNIN